MNDVIHDNEVRLIVEWRSTHGHLVHQYSETPPIDHFIIFLSQDHFRRKVLSSAAHSASLFQALIANQLAQTEVRDLQMSLRVNKNIFGLNISVDEAHGVQVIQSKNKFCRVEPCVFFRKAYFFPQMIEELTPIHKVKHEKYPLWRLEGIVERH